MSDFVGFVDDMTFVYYLWACFWGRPESIFWNVFFLWSIYFLFYNPFRFELEVSYFGGISVVLPSLHFNLEQFLVDSCIFAFSGAEVCCD